MKRCPNCKAGNVVLSRGRASRKVGEFSLAGAQLKTSARICDIAECSAGCGWKVYGHVLGAVYDERSGEFTAGTFEQDRSLGHFDVEP